MKSGIHISASILAGDQGIFREEIRSVTAAGVDWIHIDVMDGHFVPPITFGDNICKVAKEYSSALIDTHLMVTNPEKHIDRFISAGADLITVHAEATGCKKALLEIQKNGTRAGIALNPETEAKAILPYLELVDIVLVMTVSPGKAGQQFRPECLTKIKAIRDEIEKHQKDILIQVDGGIDVKTARQCTDCGARILVSGTSLMKSTNRKETIKALRGS